MSEEKHRARCQSGPRSLSGRCYSHNRKNAFLTRREGGPGGGPAVAVAPRLCYPWLAAPLASCPVGQENYPIAGFCKRLSRQPHSTGEFCRGIAWQSRDWDGRSKMVSAPNSIHRCHSMLCTPPNPPKKPASNDGHGLPDRRQLALELRRARQAHIPRLPPQPAGPRRAGRGVPRRPGSRRSTRARLKTVTPRLSRSCTDTPTIRNSPQRPSLQYHRKMASTESAAGARWQRSLRLSFPFGVTSPRFRPAPPAPFCARTRVLRGKTEWKFLGCLGRMSGCPSQETLNLSPG